MDRWLSNAAQPSPHLPLLADPRRPPPPPTHTTPAPRPRVADASASNSVGEGGAAATPAAGSSGSSSNQQSLPRKNDLVVWLRLKPLQRHIYTAFLHSDRVKAVRSWGHAHEYAVAMGPAELRLPHHSSCPSLLLRVPSCFGAETGAMPAMWVLR